MSDAAQQDGQDGGRPAKERQVSVGASELERLRRAARELEELKAEARGTGAVAPPGASPNPEWAPGDKPRVPFAGGHRLFKTDEVKSCYPLLVSSVVPRPIAFVSSCLPDGSGVNLAPYSYFNAMGHDPPIIAVGCSQSGGKHKDSFTNIEATQSFVVNIIGQWMVEAANETCGTFPRDVDEFGAGLTKAASALVPAPRVQESAVSLECKVEAVQHVGGSAVVIAKVVAFHVQSELVDESHTHPSVKFEEYHPVSRLGGNDYGLVTRRFTIGRPPSDNHKKWPSLH